MNANPYQRLQETSDGSLRSLNKHSDSWREKMDTAPAIETSIDDLAILTKPDEAAALNYIESDEATLANSPVAPDKLQFWESEHTRPDFQTGSGGNDELVAATET